MENASKALIMAGSILIGVLIISTFVYLFNTMGQYTAEAEERRAQTQVDMFNVKFTKYTGQVTYVDEHNNIEVKDVTCSMHDVISLANLAKQNNESRGIFDRQNYDDNSFYVQVDFLISGNRIDHLEYYINEAYADMLKTPENLYVERYDGDGNFEGYDLRQYRCELGYAKATGRVNYVKITKYP